MATRKKNTQPQVSESTLHFREKRKWQIALRRYILEKNKSSMYAPYYGLDIEKFREWIEIQFDKDLSWTNFSEAWQFDHIIPVAYFNFSDEADLRLCWNFTNIRVEKTLRNKHRGNRIDVLGAKNYFEVLFEKTKYHVCALMIEKLTRIEVSQIASNEALEHFVIANQDYLATTAGLSAADFLRLNTGTSLKSLQFEKDFLKKFGS